MLSFPPFLMSLQQIAPIATALDAKNRKLQQSNILMFSEFTEYFFFYKVICRLPNVLFAVHNYLHKTHKPS